MRHHRKETGLGRDIAALLGGFLLAAPFLLLMAGLTVWMGIIPQAALRIPAAIGWGLAAFWASRCISRRRRHHGLLLGALCGGLYWGMRMSGALLLGIPLHKGMLWFGAWLLLAGMTGGVVGVNTKCPPK